MKHTVEEFKGFTYTNARMYLFPRIRTLKDGVIRIAGLSGYRGPAWVSLVRHATEPDCDMFAHFGEVSLPEAKYFVVREGIGLTVDGLWLLRALLPMRERELFELGLTNGERNILSLGSGNGPIYPSKANSDGKA